MRFLFDYDILNPVIFRFFFAETSLLFQTLLNRRNPVVFGL